MAKDADNELTSYISISETSDKSPDTLKYLTDVANYRETLYQRANRDESFTFMKANLRPSSIYCHAYTTLTKLYEHLDELYGDPNKERNAQQAFKSLVIKKGQTFQKFYAIFLRSIADSNISFHDLKDDLNNKLTWKL
ncbi:MAG: hypothetical protein M1839_003948 [Geoglossum umbratile]|nr:MAG: hypothetical protein M1839_003948 [Geoglossum umbratile]